MVQLTQNNDYFPTVSLNSIFSKVLLNFGREPFHFNFEAYVQTELATVLNTIESQQVSKAEVKSLVINFTKHYGYSKTYSALTKVDQKKHRPVQKQLDCNKENKVSAKTASSGVRRSHGEPGAEKGRAAIDINIRMEVGPARTLTPKLLKKQSRSTVDLKASLLDKSYFPQRSLIHVLMQNGKFTEAEKIISLCFPELVGSEILQAHLKVHGFILLCTTNQLAALEYAKTHFVGSVRRQKFLFCTPEKLIGTATVTVALV